MSKKKEPKRGKKRKADKAKLKSPSKKLASKKVKRSGPSADRIVWLNRATIHGAANSINMSPAQKGLATKAVTAILRTAFRAQEDGADLGKVLRSVMIGSDGSGGYPLIRMEGLAAVLASKRAISEVRALNPRLFGEATQAAAKDVLEELVRQAQVASAS